LLRHASQNSLDESSQRNSSNAPEEDEFKAPYKNTEHFERAFGTLDSLRKYELDSEILNLVFPDQWMILISVERMSGFGPEIDSY